MCISGRTKQCAMILELSEGKTLLEAPPCLMHKTIFAEGYSLYRNSKGIREHSFLPSHFFCFLLLIERLT